MARIPVLFGTEVELLPRPIKKYTIRQVLDAKKILGVFVENPTVGYENVHYLTHEYKGWTAHHWADMQGNGECYGCQAEKLAR